MFRVIEVRIIQCVGSDIQAVDTCQHTADDHHFSFFGIGAMRTLGSASVMIRQLPMRVILEGYHFSE